MSVRLLPAVVAKVLGAQPKQPPPVTVPRYTYSRSEIIPDEVLAAMDERDAAERFRPRGEFVR